MRTESKIERIEIFLQPLRMVVVLNIFEIKQSYRIYLFLTAHSNVQQNIVREKFLNNGKKYKF